MLRLLTARVGLRRLFAADAVSMIGDWLAYVAVGMLAMDGPQGIVGVALIQLAYTLPQSAAAPIAGWLADRMDRRHLMIAASIGRGAIAVAMTLSAAAGEIVCVEVLLFLRMAGAAFVTAPMRAALPQLVDSEELEPANRLLATSWSVIFTVGVVLGGLIAGLMGATTALALDALTFFCAALMFGRLPSLPGERRSRANPRTDLFADARRYPDRLRAALAKVPALFAHGGIWVLLHTLAGVGGVGLGTLHAARGVGSGVGPWLFRKLGPARSVSVGVSLIVGASVVIVTCDGALRYLGCLLWGLGIGGVWVGAAVRLQRTVPSDVLGRYAAIDTGAGAAANAIGGIVAALLATVFSPLTAVLAIGAGAFVWLACSQPRARAGLAVAGTAAWLLLCVPIVGEQAEAQLEAHLDAPSLSRELRVRAVTDEDFARSELYSWTTEEQAAVIRQSGALLQSGPADGAVRSPYQVALDHLIAEGGIDGELAYRLSEHPALSRRRYSWPTPYGTAISRGSRPYGPVLIRMQIDPAGWTVRFAPDESPAFRIHTVIGESVPLEHALRSPERIAAVFHVRTRARIGPFREYIVHNESLVRRYSIDTPAIAARVDEDRRIVERVRRALASRSRTPRHRPRAWLRAPEDTASIATLYDATLPFDTRRHRPSADNLRALSRALQRYRPRGPPFSSIESANRE